MRVRFTIIMLALLLVPMAARGAMTARYITTTGTASYTSCTNILYPTSINAIATSSTAGDHWYVDDGTYNLGSTTWAKNGTVGSPIIVEGYSSTPGDGYLGRTNVNGPLITTNMPTLSYSSGAYPTVSGSYVRLQNIVITGSRNWFFLTSSGIGAQYVNCSVTNTLNDSSASACDSAGATTIFFNSDFWVTGTASTYCVRGSTTQYYHSCQFHGTGASAKGLLNLTGAYNAVISCIFYSCAGVGINYGETAQVIDSNTFYSMGTNAIQAPNFGKTNVIAATNNFITDSGRAFYNPYGGTAAHPIFSAYNRTRDNTSADSGFGDWPAIGAVTTDTGDAATDYKDAANGDLRLIPTSPGVSARVDGGELGAIPRPKAALPAAADVKSGTTYGYSQDGLTTGTYSGGGGVIVIED